MRNSLAAYLLMTAQVSSAVCQQRSLADGSPTARVEVIAFEANGRPLGAPNVTVFASAAGENMSAKFHDGVAEGLPYGIYRIETKLPWYYSDATYAMVYQPNVTIVMGLRFAAELPKVPLMLSGRVTGLSTKGKHFVKIVGVFEHISTESAIDQDGRFNLAGLASGRYIILVIGERGVMSSRSVTIPYIGPPLEIKIGGDEVAPP